METYTDYCGKCKIKDVPLTRYRKERLSNGVLKHYHYCRECNAARHRSWYNRNPEKGRAIVRKSTIKHQIKQIARALLNAAIKHKMLTRPDRCSACDKVCRVDGHHEDYSKPLEVVWLCRGCHLSIYHPDRGV